MFPHPKMIRRYERKFPISTHSYKETELLIKEHPALFIEVYPERFVNSIYLDSINHRSYTENLSGTAERTKLRIRWYGPLLGNSSPTAMEIKTKQGLLGSKHSFPMKPLTLASGFGKADLLACLKQSSIPDDARVLLCDRQPSLLIRYRRKYYRTVDWRFRLTLDTDINYYPLGPIHNSLLNRYSERNLYIIELKYSQEHDPAAAEVTRHLPFRIGRNSKYIRGMERLASSDSRSLLAIRLSK